jgi:hypothetical protein
MSDETYSSGSACMYMSGIDLYWYFDNCTDLHYVVCQVANGKFLVIQASGYANYDTVKVLVILVQTCPYVITP